MQCKEHRRVVQICVVVLIARLYMGFECVCRGVDVVRAMAMQCGRVTSSEPNATKKQGQSIGHAMRSACDI